MSILAAKMKNIVLIKTASTNFFVVVVFAARLKKEGLLHANKNQQWRPSLTDKQMLKMHINVKYNNKKTLRNPILKLFKESLCFT